MKQVRVRFTEESAGKNDVWWESLTKKQQREYVKIHPKSKYAKRGASSKPEATNSEIKFKGKNGIAFTPAKPKKEKMVAPKEETRIPKKKREKVANPDAQVGFKSKNGIAFTPAKPKKEKQENGIVFTPAKPKKEKQEKPSISIKIKDKIKSYKYAIKRIKEDLKEIKDVKAKSRAKKQIEAYRQRIESLMAKLEKKVSKPDSAAPQVGFRSRHGISFTPAKRKETSAVNFKNKQGISFEAFGGKTYTIVDGKGVTQFGPYEDFEEARDKFLEIIRRAKGSQIVGWKIKTQKAL